MAACTDLDNEMIYTSHTDRYRNGIDKYAANSYTRRPLERCKLEPSHLTKCTRTLESRQGLPEKVADRSGHPVKSGLHGRFLPLVSDDSLSQLSLSLLLGARPSRRSPTGKHPRPRPQPRRIQVSNAASSSNWVEPQHLPYYPRGLNSPPPAAVRYWLSSCTGRSGPVDRFDLNFISQFDHVVGVLEFK